MGTFTTKFTVWNPTSPDSVQEMEALVDTGAAFSWISRARLESLGLNPSRRMSFRTIDGRVMERDMTAIYIASAGYSAPDMVVMAEPGEYGSAGRPQHRGSRAGCRSGAEEAYANYYAGSFCGAEFI